MLLAVSFALVAQAAPAPAAAPPPAKQRVLVLDLRNDGAKPEHARLVTDNIVVALSRFTQLEVVSSEDVRRMVQTEGEKQSLGCTDDSCLTEIASAMGASLVVHGSIGKLESLTVVNLSLYDSKAGKSIGREAIQVQRLDDLPYLVEDATARLVRPLLGAAPERSSSSSASSSAPTTPPPDGPKANRWLAGGLAGGASCCCGAGLLIASALPGINCLVCTLGGGAVALSGAVGPVLGGMIGGAPFTSVLLPAGVGLGVGALVGITTGTVIAFVVPVPSGGGPSALLGPTLIGAIPVGIVTGLAAGLATGFLIDDPEPPPTTATNAERALPNANQARYAMAY